eukprot:836446-Pelagomonas_calceolata.AAC.6
MTRRRTARARRSTRARTASAIAHAISTRSAAAATSTGTRAGHVWKCRCEQCTTTGRPLVLSENCSPKTGSYQKSARRHEKWVKAGEKPCSCFLDVTLAIAASWAASSTWHIRSSKSFFTTIWTSCLLKPEFPVLWCSVASERLDAEERCTIVILMATPADVCLEGLTQALHAWLHVVFTNWSSQLANHAGTTTWMVGTTERMRAGGGK